MKKTERKEETLTKTKAEKRVYRKPEVESTEVFETFTLQSCNLTPDDDCIGLFE